MKKPRREKTRLERMRLYRDMAAESSKEWERKLALAMTKVRYYRRVEKRYTREIEKELEIKGPKNPTRIVEA